MGARRVRTLGVEGRLARTNPSPCDQMNRLLKRIQDFHVRRRERDQRRLLEQWGVIRAKGKARYLLRSTLFFGLGVAALNDIVAHILGTQPASLLSNLIKYSIMGLVIAFFTWWDTEGRYKAACIDTYRKSLLSGNDPRD
jgi:hypothetical protein